MKYFIRRRYKPFVTTIDFLGGAYKKIKHIFVRPKKLQKEKVKKILMLSLDLIGDGILATPTLRTIRENFPNAEITAMVGKWNEKIFENNPDIDKVKIIDPFWTRSTNLNVWQKIKSFVKIYESIKKENYDLAIDLRGEFLSILLMRKTGAKYIAGYGITGGGWILDKCVKYEGDRFAKHVIERNLDILRALDLKISDNLDLAIYPSKENKEVVDKFLRENNIKENDKIVVIHPGSNDQARCWENKKWAEAASRFIENGFKVILSGGPNDGEMVESIISNFKFQSPARNASHNDAGGSKQCQMSNVKCQNSEISSFMGYSILDFAELIKKAGLVLCVNSAALHITCAQKVPVVTLFAGSYPRTYGPWSVCNRGKQNLKSVVLFKDAKCFPCGKKYCENNVCMKDITVDEVTEGVKILMQNSKTKIQNVFRK